MSRHNRRKSQTSRWLLRSVLNRPETVGIMVLYFCIFSALDIGHFSTRTRQFSSPSSWLLPHRGGSLPQSMALTTDLFVPGHWPQLLLVPGCEQVNNHPPSFLSGDKGTSASHSWQIVCIFQPLWDKTDLFTEPSHILPRSQAAPPPLRATKAGR